MLQNEVQESENKWIIYDDEQTEVKNTILIDFYWFFADFFRFKWRFRRWYLRVLLWSLWRSWRELGRGRIWRENLPVWLSLNSCRFSNSSSRWLLLLIITLNPNNSNKCSSRVLRKMCIRSLIGIMI